MIISTSLLNVEENGKEIETFYRLEAAKTDYFHIDVMDGKFVENDTQERMKRFADILSNVTITPMEVHLMCEDVKSFVNEYTPVNPNVIIFHIEVCKDESQVMDYINYIKEKGCKVGISLKPGTKVEDVLPYLKYVHEVLVMTVEPGKGNQKLIEETLDKRLRYGTITRKDYYKLFEDIRDEYLENLSQDEINKFEKYVKCQLNLPENPSIKWR